MLIKFKSWLRKKILEFLQIEAVTKNIIIRESPDINKIVKEIYELQRKIQGKRL